MMLFQSQQRALVHATVLLCLGAACASASARAPISAFQHLSVRDLARVQFKLSDVGDHDCCQKPTLILAQDTAAVSLGLYFHFYRMYGYVGDTFDVPKKRVVSASEMRAIIDAMARIPGVADGGVDPRGYASVSLARLTVGGDTLVFEKVLDVPNGTLLFHELRRALRSNSVALAELEWYTCPFSFFEGEPPADVTRTVHVTLRGFSRSHPSRYFVATAHIINTGASIPGPVSLVLEFEGRVWPIGQVGTTCRVARVGRPYYNLPILGSMSHGQVVDLQFKVPNPHLEPVIVDSLWVFSGPGDR